MKTINGAAILTCGVSAPKAPPPPPPAPQASDPAVVASQDNERRRRRAAPSNTFLTSFTATPAAVAPLKTLLGS